MLPVINKSWYKKDRGYLQISSLSNNDRELLMWRSGVRKIIANAPDSVNENHHNSVCYYHHSMFFTCYEAKQKKCINPFGLHPNSRKKKQCQGQHTIPLAMAQLYQNEAQCTALIPGQKLCKDCWHKSKSLKKQTGMSSCSESADSTCSEDSEFDQNF